MAPHQNKRVKGTKITRHFIIGNTWSLLPATGFPDPAPEGHTKGWRVYVRPLPNGPDITTWLRKVQFKLHHTYADPSRIIEAPGPFEVQETGYGEFNIEIRLYFAPESSEKAVYREHWLVLQPPPPHGTGTEGEVPTALPDTAGGTAERLETVEFNEPTTEFFRALVSEEQYNWLKVKRGRGKGKKAEMVFEGDVPPSAQLPEQQSGSGGGGDGGSGGDGPGTGAAWSKVYEKQIVAQLVESERILESAVDQEKAGMETRRKRMEELGMSIPAK